MNKYDIKTVLAGIYLGVLCVALHFGQVTDWNDNLINALVRFYTGV